MRVARTFALLFGLLLAMSSLAASTAERSPFAQGLWWDPMRSGHGFELWNTAEHAALIWFTYDDAGRPTWYTAAGPRANLGREAWPLLQHRWNAGGSRTTAVVGNVQLDVRHTESVLVSWELGGKRGVWAIQPLAVSGVVNEVDPSGVWFDPANSGWGLSLTDQGDAFGAVLYTYDASGAPTWALGFARGGSRTIEMQRYVGACPSCVPGNAAATGIGTLAFQMRGESALTVTSRINLAMPAGVNVDGAAMTQLGRPASLRAADRRLAHFADDAALSAYLAAGMLNLPSNDTGSFSSPPPAVVFSQTNLQEQGVDEADSVKSDGTQVYTFAHGENGVRRAALRIAAVGNDGASLQVLGTVPLANGSDSDVATAGLFLHDGSLVALTGTQAASPVGWPWLNASAWLRGVTNVEILDASTRGTLASRWHAQLDGHLVASRRIGSRLYVVTRYAPYLSTFLYGASTPDSVEANRRLLARTPLAALLPKARIGGGEARPALPSTAVLVPPPGARRPMADMIVVTAIDIAAPAIVQALAIVGNVETVYASPGNLFVASSRYVLRDGFGLPVAAEPPFIATDIHQIRLGADAMQGVGSASVEGSFGYQGDKGAFRMGEHGGRLRVVTSSQGLWGGENRNRLTILEPSTTSPGLLRTVSFLPNAQRPQPLGKPNEVLYGTRFAGDRLYAVTFRRIDPLYVVDLSDPADPRIASALEIPGFSEYLHPLPNGLLLGFGQSAEVAGTIGDGQWAWFAGLQLSLFDVRDADRPRELQRVVLGKRGSDSALLRHHHALSMLEQPDGARVLAFPARIHDGVAPPWADPSYAYPWLQSGLARFELRGTTAADARLVQLPMLVTHGGSLGNPPGDGSADDARSVLFRNGTIYVSGGRFWRQDPGGTTFGPF